MDNCRSKNFCCSLNLPGFEILLFDLNSSVFVNIAK